MKSGNLTVLTLEESLTINGGMTDWCAVGSILLTAGLLTFDAAMAALGLWLMNVNC